MSTDHDFLNVVHEAVIADAKRVFDHHHDQVMADNDDTPTDVADLHHALMVQAYQVCEALLAHDYPRALQEAQLLLALTPNPEATP